MRDPAIVALTPRGAELGRRLADGLGRGEVIPAEGNAAGTVRDLFEAGRPLVCIMALGIVVRVLGPLARDKEADSPVVVMDEAGRFAVSVLGGHGAGANLLAREAAAAVGALPVITTASDALGLPAVDLIGQGLGWKVEGREHLTRLAAAVVRGEPVSVYQDAGRTDWWQEFGAWPESFQRVTAWPPGSCAAALVISDRTFPEGPPCPVVYYRPPTLVLGVGCRRGVPAEEIEALFQEVCRTRNFSPLSLAVVATASLKADEPGLREFAARHGVALRPFSLEELGSVTDLPTPSERVRAKLGISGVAEPAAMLAAGIGSLVMPKYKGQRVTLALARTQEAIS